MVERKHLSLWRARDEAAAETLERFHKDGESKRWHTRSFLQYLEDHWFDEGLGVQRIMRACKITDRSFPTYFHAELGESPSHYIRNSKMRVASRLLRTTNYEIALIGEAVGIPSPTQFSRVFRRWAGETPRAYRNRHNMGESLAFYDPQFVEAAFAGQLEQHQAELYVAYLQDLSSFSAPEADPVPDSISDETLVAEVLLRKLRNKTLQVQREIVRYQYDFRTPALFDLLLEKSRRELRRFGPQCAIRWSELALVSLEGRTNRLGSQIFDLRTRGWAWLGNARRLAFDFPGSVEAFEHAERAWNGPRVVKDNGALADLLALKAMLRYFQRCFEEALDLNGRALRLLRKQHASEPLAQALIARAAMKGSAGRPEETFDELQEALRILEKEDLPDLQLTGLVNLATSYALAGLTKEAKRVLDEAKSLAKENPHRTAEFHLVWVEGLVEKAQNDIKSAELLFLRAKDGFAGLGQGDYEAVVSIDLALIYVESGRNTEALRLVEETIPFFESFKVRREAIAARQLIRDAVSQSSLPLTLLYKIRSKIELLRKDPWFGNPSRCETLEHVDFGVE